MLLVFFFSIGGVVLSLKEKKKKKKEKERKRKKKKERLQKRYLLRRLKTIVFFTRNVTKNRFPATEKDNLFHGKKQTCKMKNMSLKKKKKTVIFNPPPDEKVHLTGDPSQKKRSVLGGSLTFPIVKNDAGKHKSKKVCVFF